MAVAEDHRHAGQGAVVLDIGGEVGALVVRMPAGLIGTEIGICPVGTEHAATHAHVAVLARPVGARTLPTAVFPSLRQGSYELYRRPAGPTELVAQVCGGQVRELAWPGT